MNRVHIMVPGAEGSWIARSLRDADLEVSESRSASHEGASVLVADVATESLSSLLARFDGPVFLVGWDADPPNAFASYPYQQRPVAIASLVEQIRRELSLESPESRVLASHLDDSLVQRIDASHVPLDSRESTVTLDDEDEPSGVWSSQLENSSITSAPMRALSVVNPEAAEFSPYLTHLMREADRRLFGHETPLVLRFPGSEMNVEELVPDELMGEISLPLELPIEADPLDNFTFIGAPDLSSALSSALESVAGSQGGHAESVAGAQAQGPEISGGEKSVGQKNTGQKKVGESTTASRSARAKTQGTTQGGRAEAPITRQGTLTTSGALALAWQLQDLGGAYALSLSSSVDLSVTITLQHGEVVAFQGPVALHAAHALHRLGKIAHAPADDVAAQEALRDACAFGALTIYARDRALRAARESLLGQLFLTTSARFRLEEESPSRLGEPLIKGSLIACLTRQAQARVEDDRGSLDRGSLDLGSLDRGAAYALTPEFWRRVREMQLAPELGLAIARSQGQALQTLLATEAGAAGLAGALFVLGASDALTWDRSEQGIEASGAAARALVKEEASRAEDANYFELLGLAPGATSREVEDAHHARASSLRSLDLNALDLEELAPLRRFALQALCDAKDALSDPQVRAAYAAALGLSAPQP